MIEANIICDSVNPAGIRLTTFICKYPRFIHSELMTHRQLSRNASSSRAIPISKSLQAVIQDPAMPVSWPKNQPGMQASEILDKESYRECMGEILCARDDAVTRVKNLMTNGLHKQIANRYLEPWAHMTTLISGTDWANFYALRVHKDAQPEFQELAYKMLKAYVQNVPRSLNIGSWHIPFQDHMPEDLILAKKVKIAVGRCARVSYKNQDGEYNVADDLKLYDRLVSARPGHWSAFEHVAEARNDSEYSGNFRGWRQYRKMFESENTDTLDFKQHLRDYELSKS